MVSLPKDDDRSVRQSAAIALGEQTTLPENTLQALVSVMDEDGGDRRLKESAADVILNDHRLRRH